MLNDRDEADYVRNYVDRQIAALQTAGERFCRIEMTAGAQSMLRQRYFPDAPPPAPDGGIFRYRGFPVETARLDVPAVVYAEMEKDPIHP